MFSKTERKHFTVERVSHVEFYKYLLFTSHILAHETFVYKNIITADENNEGYEDLSYSERFVIREKLKVYLKSTSYRLLQILIFHVCTTL